MNDEITPEATPHPEETGAFALGGNASTLAFVNSFLPEKGTITARLLPLARTPLGVVLGDRWQNVGVALSGLMDWVDKTFPPEDEHAFVAPLRDIELLIRVQWHTPAPARFDETTIINEEDVPDDVLDGLGSPPSEVVQCATCRRLCVKNDFVWKEKQLCAWDYHAAAFGKRGPWHDGPYEDRHFETVPSCAYVAPPLLTELGVESILAIAGVDDVTARSVINAVLNADAATPHLAVRTELGYTLLRERGTTAPA